ncbi:MAG: hypothetical protein AAF501_22265, partial [Pseudomonadota bacterium]
AARQTASRAMTQQRADAVGLVDVTGVGRTRQNRPDPRAENPFAPPDRETPDRETPPHLRIRPFEIQSRTLQRAPNRAPSTRREIGVGEWIRFSMADFSRPVWQHPGQPDPIGPQASLRTRWTTPGRRTIFARLGRQIAAATVDVVEPRVDPVKISGLTFMQARSRLIANGFRVPPPGPMDFGCYMQLALFLEPRRVAFSNIGFREVHAPAINPTGYYLRSPGRTRPHRPNPAFTPTTVLQGRNVVGLPDLSGFYIRAAPPNLPITHGSYQWSIPGEYKIQGGGVAHRLRTTVTQRFFVAPNPDPLVAGPFTGLMNVTKGRASHTV